MCAANREIKLHPCYVSWCLCGCCVFLALQDLQGCVNKRVIYFLRLSLCLSSELACVGFIHVSPWVLERRFLVEPTCSGIWIVSMTKTQCPSSGFPQQGACWGNRAKSAMHAISYRFIWVFFLLLMKNWLGTLFQFIHADVLLEPSCECDSEFPCSFSALKRKCSLCVGSLKAGFLLTAHCSFGSLEKLETVATCINTDKHKWKTNVHLFNKKKKRILLHIYVL